MVEILFRVDTDADTALKLVDIITKNKHEIKRTRKEKEKPVLYNLKEVSMLLDIPYTTLKNKKIPFDTVNKKKQRRYDIEKVKKYLKGVESA